ncbi:uncharacterized protein PAC_01515 [Phialocephala subalpina]|uniref:Uncharacterized protein n=1 Tax=Phialocephala subalpina TaxID=576137 RepID=A0A1L7WFV2_9HELO|nr:uncharacterized protein PAC_01515 [Phialocephala subalpina]
MPSCYGLLRSTAPKPVWLHVLASMVALLEQKYVVSRRITRRDSHLKKIFMSLAMQLALREVQRYSQQGVWQASTAPVVAEVVQDLFVETERGIGFGKISVKNGKLGVLKPEQYDFDNASANAQEAGFRGNATRREKKLHQAVFSRVSFEAVFSVDAVQTRVDNRGSSGCTSSPSILPLRWQAGEEKSSAAPFRTSECDDKPVRGSERGSVRPAGNEARLFKLLHAAIQSSRQQKELFPDTHFQQATNTWDDLPVLRALGPLQEGDLEKALSPKYPYYAHLLTLTFVAGKQIRVSLQGALPDALTRQPLFPSITTCHEGSSFRLLRGASATFHSCAPPQKEGPYLGQDWVASSILRECDQYLEGGSPRSAASIHAWQVTAKSISKNDSVGVIERTLSQ